MEYGGKPLSRSPACARGSASSAWEGEEVKLVEGLGVVFCLTLLQNHAISSLHVHVDDHCTHGAGSYIAQDGTG